jgi:phosphoserine phosphatase
MSVVPPDLTATLVLVRHGETTWIVQNRFQGRRNPWLTARGRKQAEAVARRLADPEAPPPLPIPPGPPVAIWHSPLKRAKDTAATIAARVPVPLVPDERLAEMSQGAWESLSHRAVAGLGDGLEAWRRDPAENSAPGGESLRDAEPRVEAALAAILERLGAARAGAPPTRSPWGIVVSHGGTMRVALLALLGLPLQRFWEFPFDPGAITIVEIENGQAILRAHNVTSHLGDAGAPETAPETAPVDRGGAL